MRTDIATLEWDYPGKSQNILNHASLTTFVEACRMALADSSVKWPADLLGEEGFHRRR
jgi:enoyl-CoA hydratase/carnithine racemase